MFAKRRGFAFLGLGLFAALIWFSGCQRGGKQERVFRIAIPRPITSLDPVRVGDALTLQVHINAYQTLVGVDRDGHFVPGIARSWEHDSTGKRWVFHLGSYKFCPQAGGAEVTSNDVIASFERAARNPRSIVGWVFRDYVEGGEAFASGKADSISGLRALSKNELEVRLTVPVDIAARFALPQLSILPESLARRTDLDLDGAGQTYGSGPYRVVYVEPNKIVLEKNPNWSGELDFARAEFVVYRDVQAALAQVKAGGVDLVSVPLTHWKQVESRSLGVPVQVLEQTVHFEHYILNARDKQLQDVHLRRALMLSINRKRLCEEVLAGGAIPTDFTSAMARRKAEDLYNPAEAEREWKLAAVHPKVLELVTTPEYEQQLVAAYLRDAWRESFGIELRISSIEFGSLMANLFGGKPYQVARFWVQPLVDLPEIWFMTFRPGDPPPRGRNFSGYNSKEFEQLFLHSLLPTDLQDREKMLSEMDRILERDVPVIPLFQRKYAFARSTRAKLEVGYALRYHIWEAKAVK